jgi:hypothetical protein
VKCEQVDWYIVVFDGKTKLVYSNTLTFVAGFEVLAAVTMECTFLWDVRLCSSDFVFFLGGGGDISFRSLILKLCFPAITDDWFDASIV